MAAVDRLRDHDSVVVTLPRGHYILPTSFAARILAVEGMTVALEVEDKAETARLPDRVPNAFLTFRHADSLVGFRGTLHTARPVGDFRFVVAELLDFRLKRVDFLNPGIIAAHTPIVGRAEDFTGEGADH